MNDKYLLAFDIGGTKADAVLFNTHGEVLSHRIDKGGIPFDIGKAQTIENIVSSIKALINDAGVTPSVLYASIATLDYYDESFKNEIKNALGIETMRLEEDGPCLISAMIGHKDGACLICGTGSALYFRQGDTYSHIGGGGHFVDSCGSGFRLGSQALRAALRADDGSERETVLMKLLTERNNGLRPWQDQEKLYALGRGYVASYADCVFKARDMGDVAARRIFNENASDLADVIWGAYRRLGGPFTLIMNGGIVTHYKEYADAIKAMAPKDVTYIISDVPPAYGCAVEAMHDLGLECDESFKQTFLKTYGETKPKSKRSEG